MYMEKLYQDIFKDHLTKGGVEKWNRLYRELQY